MKIGLMRNLLLSVSNVCRGKNSRVVNYDFAMTSLAFDKKGRKNVWKKNRKEKEKVWKEGETSKKREERRENK